MWLFTEDKKQSSCSAVTECCTMAAPLSCSATWLLRRVWHASVPTSNVYCNETTVIVYLCIFLSWPTYYIVQGSNVLWWMLGRGNSRWGMRSMLSNNAPLTLDWGRTMVENQTPLWPQSHSHTGRVWVCYQSVMPSKVNSSEPHSPHRKEMI